jgi:capsular exopolysaccharide synthesis family protein
MDLNKNPQPQPQEAKLHFLDYWRIIRIRKAIIITVFLITAIIATAVTFILPESYSSTCRIKVELEGPDVSTLTGNPDVSRLPYDPFFMQTTFEIMQSQVVLSNAINELNLNVEWGKKFYGGETLKTSETMELLKHRMDLKPVRNTKLIAITVYSEDKNECARVANTVATSYKKYREDLGRQVKSGGLKAFQEKADDTEAKIKAASTNVEYLRGKFKIQDNDPNALNPSPTLSSEQLHAYNAQKIDGERSYNEYQKRLDQLQSYDTNKLRDVLPTVTEDSMLVDLLGKLHAAQQQYVTLTNDYTAADLHIIRIQSTINELNHEIDDRVTGIMLGMESEVKSKKANLDSLTAFVERAKATDQEEQERGQPYWDEKRNLEHLVEFQKILSAKIEAEKLELEMPTTAAVQITDYAEPSVDPVKPNKTLNITLGLIFGLIMGVGLAFFIEYLDTSVKTIDDVERAFQAPVLGVIPQSVGILADEGTESKHAEAYRVLRTNILFSRKDDQLNSIVVVSAGAGEGKSTTTLNLATVFAQTGQRVLLVDSDLRRPTLHKLLRVGNNIGLTNYLLKQNTLTEVIQTTNVPMLDFMASGKLPNSSMGILGSGSMKEMISELKQRYDYIFFDSPPILGVSDASILASEMDLVVQVIQYRRYPQPMNIRAKQMIEKVGGNFIGIVLNNINMSQDESYYYYSGYYHDYYYSRTEKDQEAAALKPPGTPGAPGGAPATPPADSSNPEPTGSKQKY